jgi:hypothetical protein
MPRRGPAYSTAIDAGEGLSRYNVLTQRCDNISLDRGQRGILNR